MKIVVFGGSGFLGSHVADVLSQQNHHVVIYDLQPSPYLRRDQEMVVGDMMDLEKVTQTVKGAHAVYNFAGIADIDKAKENGRRTINVNVMGHTNILEACREQQVRRFLFASTVYVYSESGSFYRASKQACELVTEVYHKQHGIDFTILRYGSLYGTRADISNWIHRALLQALTEKKITRCGDGEEIRNYIHVHDAARLSAMALDDKYKNEYIIVTGQETITIRNLMVMIKEILNNEVDLEFLANPNETHYEITPYNFKPKLAKRMTDGTHIDLGQGILELLSEIYEERYKDTVGREKWAKGDLTGG